MEHHGGTSEPKRRSARPSAPVLCSSTRPAAASLGPPPRRNEPTGGLGKLGTPPPAKIDRIEVNWPSGKKQTLSEGIAVNTLLTITEPKNGN